MRDYKVRFSFRIPKVILLVGVIWVLWYLLNFGVQKATGIVDSLFSIYKEYDTFAEDVLKDVSSETFYTSKETKIYFSDGTLLTKLSKSDKHNYLRMSDIPVDVVNAFIAIEDKRFYLHKGVDWQSTVYAGVMEVLTHGHSSRGGSTITQQLARNKFLTFEKSYERKLKEILIALKLEERFSKEEIMEFYINTINFSNNYYGINAAANGYFHKDISECSVAEIALLCAIPNNPSVYNPRTNLENTIKRRNIILREMYADGFITREMYFESIESTPEIFSSMGKDFYNYESSFAIKCAVEEIMESNGFEFKYYFKSDKKYKKYQEVYQEVYEDTLEAMKSSGLTIKTSLNRKVQKKIQKAVDDQLKNSKKKQKNKVYLLQGAATVIDNSTGYVVGIVGGRTQKGITDVGINTLNRAYQSYRQPGSTIKPLIVYAPSIENGMRPYDLVDDSFVEDGPHNADGKYAGEIYLRDAVEKSKNVVAWSLFKDLGVNKGLRKLQQMQFSKILASDYNLAAALGGLTKGVTTVEMAGGYATLANKGVYRKPTCITCIVRDDGSILMSGRKEVRVYSDIAAEYMTDILTGVAIDGTAAGLSIGDNIPIACKTGTTNNNVSGWFCGYSPYYTCAVYVGADDGSGTPGLYGAAEPKRIWKQIQESLCKGKDAISFDLADIEETQYEYTDLDNAEIEDMQNEVFSDGNEDLVTADTAEEDEDVILDIQGEVDKPIDIQGEVEESVEEPEEVEPEENWEEPEEVESEEPVEEIVPEETEQEETEQEETEQGSEEYVEPEEPSEIDANDEEVTEGF